MDDPVLSQTYAAAVPELSIPWQAEAPVHPELLWLNEDLARELGYDPVRLRQVRPLTGGRSRWTCSRQPRCWHVRAR